MPTLQVRMKFDVESTDFLSLMRPDVAFPPHQFAMLADEGRCQVTARSGYPKMGWGRLWGPPVFHAAGMQTHQSAACFLRGSPSGQHVSA